ncbi:MAG: hypothetical protein ACXVP1_02085, partial [Thermoleophilia bacterium]
MTPGGVNKQRAASVADALLADKVTNILVAGVGGQGVIVAAAIIAEAALLHGGLEVKLSET